MVSEALAPRIVLGFSIFLTCLIPMVNGEPIEKNVTLVENHLIIKETAGKDTTNAPVQVGRPFRQGEIQQFPIALVEGIEVETQSDVKQRWPDGSVKHAIISFHVPHLTPHGQVTVLFRNVQYSDNTPLTPAEMLNPAYNCNPIIEATLGSSIVTANAHSLLSAGKFSYWTKGPIATTVIISDNSETRESDIGFDEKRSTRPAFHITFWPKLHTAYVRYILESGNSESLQSFNLDTLAFMNGPAIVHSTSTARRMIYGSRISKSAWVGGAAPTFAIDHNMRYLMATTFVPLFDLSLEVSEPTIQARYNTWKLAKTNMFEHGLWTTSMSTTGGRAEIGIYPEWIMDWLYTFDNRMLEVSKSQAELAGTWPVHFREGRAGRRFLIGDALGSSTGLGKVVSAHGRPTLLLGAGNSYIDYAYTAAADRLSVVGSMSTQQTDGRTWYPDGAHQPDPFSVLYTLTGEYFYLEQLQFWAAWTAFSTNPGNIYYGRGPSGANGGLAGEVRALAWQLRTRFDAAFLSPDGTPEKTYFTVLSTDAIAILEGKHNIGVSGGSAYYGTPLWQWGKNQLANGLFRGLGVNPLGGVGYFLDAEAPVDPAKSAYCDSPWQHNFLVLVLSRGAQLGFATEGLHRWFGGYLVDQLTHPDYNPFLMTTYRIPTAERCGSGCARWWTTWKDVRSSFASDTLANAESKFPTTFYDSQHGYSYIGMAAASTVLPLTNGKLAWRWIQTHFLSSPIVRAQLAQNPKWAMSPDASTIPPDAPPTALSVGPAAAEGTSQIFVVQYTDDLGPRGLARVRFLINRDQRITSGCLIEVDSKSRYATLFGDAGTQGQSGLLGTPQIIRNSQCSIDLNVSSYAADGSTAILRIGVTFTPPFGGVMELWASGTDIDGLSGNGVKLGVFRSLVALSAPADYVAGTKPVAVFLDGYNAAALTRAGESVVHSAGGVFSSDPVVTLSHSGIATVVARDSFGSIWLNTFDTVSSTWGQWRSSGAMLVGRPAAVTTVGGSVWLAARDIDHAYWVCTYRDGTFSGWMRLGGVFTTDPVVASDHSGSLYVVGKDGWGALWGGKVGAVGVFSGWLFGGGAFKGSPSIAVGSDTTVRVVARDGSDGVWAARLSETAWLGWNFVGGQLGSDPVLTAIDDGSFVLTAMDRWSGLWYRRVIGEEWQGWVSTGGVLRGYSSASFSGSLYVAGVSNDDRIWWFRSDLLSWTLSDAMVGRAKNVAAAPQ